MGLFGRKVGGTFMGNLLRGAASKVSEGMFGQGVNLGKWEAKQRGEKFDNAVASQVREATQKSSGFQAGAEVGLSIKPEVDKITNSPQAEKIKMNLAITWLKDNAIKIGGFLIFIVLVVLGFKYINKGFSKPWKK